jgi:hypothetical protein
VEVKSLCKYSVVESLGNIKFMKRSIIMAGRGGGANHTTLVGPHWIGLVTTKRITPLEFIVFIVWPIIHVGCGMEVRPHSSGVCLMS